VVTNLPDLFRHATPASLAPAEMGLLGTVRGSVRLSTKVVQKIMQNLPRTSGASSSLLGGAEVLDLPAERSATLIGEGMTT